MRTLILLATTLTLAACGDSAHEKAEHSMMHSNKEYKSCLEDKGAAGCDAQKAGYDADIKAYDATGRNSND